MSTRNVLRIGVLAGVAGGAAEVAWVSGYSALTGASGAAVARGVTTALLPGLNGSSHDVGLGIVLHMLLAIGLGVAVTAAFSAPLLRRIGDWSRGTLIVLTLGLVWAFNFLVGTADTRTWLPDFAAAGGNLGIEAAVRGSHGSNIQGTGPPGCLSSV